MRLEANLCFHLLVGLLLVSSFLEAAPKNQDTLACSPDAGSLVLNEVNTKANPDYIELYFLADTSISADSWYLWVDNGQGPAVPAGDYQAGDYLLLFASLNPSNQEVFLVSSDATTLAIDAPVVVDYLGYGGLGNFHPTWTIPSDCGFVLNNHHAANEEVIDRLPDGTGGWADHGDFATPGAPNDGSTPSCPLGGFSVQAQTYALACPETRAMVTVVAQCADGTTKDDFSGTVDIGLDRTTAAVYTTSSGGSPISQVSFDGSEGGWRTLYVYDNDEHITTLSASDGSVTGSGSIDFRSFGFLLANAPTIDACITSTATLTAYGQLSGATGCSVIEGFSGTKPLKAWFDYLEPAANSAATPLRLQDANGTQTLPGSQPDSANIELDFISGVAQLSLSYADAGQLRLNLRHDLAPYDGSEFGPMLAGNLFSVTPDGFTLRAFTATGELDNPDHEGEPKWKAGEDFLLQVQARCADGTVLSNYQPGAAEMWLEMLQPAAMQPGVLALKGNDYPASYSEPVSWENISSLFSQGAIADGLLDHALARFSEVGVFRLHVRDSNYLGAAIPEQTLTVGRFTPAWLQVTATVDGQLQPACNNLFSYTGETMHYASQPALTITARNAQGLTTQNYSGNFMKLTGTAGGSVFFTAPTQDALQLGQDGINPTRLSAIINSNLGALVDHADGTLSYPLSAIDNFNYTRNGNALIAPYTSAIELTLAAITDGDGIGDDGAEVKLQPAGAEIRFGRLVIDDAYGPQTDDLPLPVRAEYYDGSGFVDNRDDYCTQLTPLAAVGLSNWQENLADGETLVNGAANLLAGSGEIRLSAPGVGTGSDTNDGSVDLTLDLSATAPLQDWLLDDTDGDGSFAENPQGTAGFGMYRGDDRFLYWREVQ
jgi:hypothetical protein